MSTTEIRQEINQYLDRLSFARLKLVADFLAYLADKESEEATQELLDIPGFIEAFERGKKILQKVVQLTGEQSGLMYEVVLSAEAQKIYASPDQALAKKIARCFEQLE